VVVEALARDGAQQMAVEAQSEGRRSQSEPRAQRYAGLVIVGLSPQAR
jgi:hypothetical protein